MVPSAVQALQITRGPSVWPAPPGILAPGFGVHDVAGAPTSWVNNLHSAATDTNNLWGTVSTPRRTVPPGLPAGTVVDVAGGPYPITQMTWGAAGTLAQPVFIRGTGSPRFIGVEGSFLRTVGAFLVLEGVVLDGVQLLVGGTAHTLRHSEVLHAAGSAVVVEPGAGGTVLFHDHIHHNGDSENPVEHDVHGVLVMHNTAYSWLLDCDVHHNGGDAIQIGQAGSPEPWARWVWIGGNTLHQDRENAVDVKRARDVIMSSNTAYGYVPRNSSLGEIVVIHDGAMRVFVLNNHLTSGGYGVSCTNGVGVFVVGNVLTNIKHTGTWTPASLYDSAAISLRNSHTVIASQNTIWNCDAGIAIPILTSGSSSEVVSNIIGGLTVPAHAIRYGTSADQALATMSHNLVPPIDPRFVAPLDFHLQADSPAKALGLRSVAHASLTSLYGATVDQDLYRTPWTGVPNIGAVA